MNFSGLTAWDGMLARGLIGPFLGTFAKLRKVIIGFSISVSPSVRMEQLGSYWVDFRENLYFSIFRSGRENSNFIKL